MRAGFLRHAACGLLLAAGLTVALAGAAELDQAASDLRSADAEVRLRACAQLAESGGMAHVPALLAALRDADERVRQRAEQAIWRIWSRSGDAETDRVFDAGVAQMQAGELREAARTFGRVIERKPEFAEGWNKRATVYFLLGENDLSLRDCDEVLKRNPQHFGVLAGYGQLWLRKGEPERALDYFERALAINPNMGGVADAVDGLRKLMAERRRKFI
jgi:tetratricopeptide (TPR) repeat protein